MPTAPSLVDRFRPHSVPVCVFAVVAAAVVVVPPLVLDPSRRTLYITVAVLILAVMSTAPYAVAVAVLTLPFQYTGLASYASPRTVPDGERPSLGDVLRHVAAGFAYVLAAGIVGGIGIGLDFAGYGTSALSDPFKPTFMLAGSAAVAVTYVGLQLWRCDTADGEADLRTTGGTIALGLLLVPTGRIALWVFGRGRLV